MLWKPQPAAGGRISPEVCEIRSDRRFEPSALTFLSENGTAHSVFQNPFLISLLRRAF